MAPITSQEKSVINQLKEKIQKELFEDDYHSSDAFLLRFLRDQDMNVNGAETALKKYITWQKNRSNNEIPNEAMHEKLSKLLPLRHGTLDRNGTPVVILEIGRWAAELTADAKNSAQFVHYFNFMMDKIVEDIIAAQKEGEIEYAFAIIDLDQLSYKQMHKDVFPTLLGTVGDMRKFFPEVFHMVQIVNAPSGFSLMFKFVKALLPKRYTERISICGKNRNEWIPLLTQRVSPDQLWKEYGGTYEL